MRKHARRLFTLFTLAGMTLACSFLIPSMAQPTPGGGTVDPSNVGTVVAMTLTALVPEAVTEAPPTVTATEEPVNRLPRTFYYLAPDSAGLNQIFRVERDGITRYQLTSESDTITDYDVSQVDGSMVYIADNELVHVNTYGSERRVLMDGGKVDQSNPLMSTVNSPVFSPDGQTVAYGYKGLRLYSFVSDQSRLMIQNLVEGTDSGFLMPRELYWPERYSPDGTKLLITLGYWESASSAIYDPATNKWIRLQGGEGAVICCDDIEWSANGSSVYAANPSMGIVSSGLWKVDAATAEVTTLIDGSAGGNTYSGADEAYLAPDGNLYFFFATFTVPDARAPLQIVRSAPDGVTGRTVLLEQSFELMNEALWAPDASFVVTAMAPNAESYQGGQAEIVYLDGRPKVVLAPFAMQMKWGP